MVNLLKARNLISTKNYAEAIAELNTLPLEPMVERLKVYCNKRARGILDCRHWGGRIYHQDETITVDEMEQILSLPLTRKRFRKDKS